MNETINGHPRMQIFKAKTCKKEKKMYLLIKPVLLAVEIVLEYFKQIIDFFQYRHPSFMQIIIVITDVQILFHKFNLLNNLDLLLHFHFKTQFSST